MDLHSDYPFWMIKEGLPASYGALRQDVTTDVLVMGGGITGALVGDELLRRGLDVTLVDKRHIGFGSTSASTALLQYEIDNPLHKLAEDIGEKGAARAYELCGDAIDELEALCARFRGRAEFRRCPSFWYASTKKDAARILEPEFRARKKHGFDVRLLDRARIESMFGLSAPAGILSALGATCHPYKLAHALIDAMVAGGARVHDLTDVIGWSETRTGIVATTAQGRRIRARHLVIACGYESQDYLDERVTRLHSTYAIVSKPVAGRKHPWHMGSMLWETKSPYLYVRTTVDGRILLGGRDETFQSPNKRDRLIGRKARELVADFAKLMPHVAFELDFAWAGTFGETRDGLPYIGVHRSRRIHYAMGYGGNGITFSVVAARLIGDAIQGKRNPDAALFAFGR